MVESKKREEKKLKKNRANTNLVYIKNFTFHKCHNTEEFAKRSFHRTWNDLIGFKDILKWFYNDTEESKLNNEDQKKKLYKRKVVITYYSFWII